MNRRIFVEAIGAVGVSAALDLGWITIAHLGTNRAGRTYTEDQMAVVARDVKPGMKIMDWYADDPPSLDQLHGLVTHARRTGEEFQVKVRWFRAPIEKSWLSLNGMMTFEGPLDGTKGFTITEVFCLNVTSAGSNFQRATAV